MWREWIERTTAHGFSHIVNSSSNKAKGFWALWIILCSVVVLQQIFTLYSSYLSRETKWTTSVHEKTNQDIKDPTITVCNFNRIAKSKAQKANFSRELMVYYFGFFPVLYPIMNMDGTNMSQEFTDWQNKSNLSRVGILQELGHACDKMFIIGGRKSARLHGEMLCEANLTKYDAAVVPVLTSEMGLCYQLQVKNRSGMKISGSLDSLNLILNTEIEEYVAESRNNYQDVGFAIQITYGGKVNFGQWTSIEAGKHTKIAIQEHKKITTYSRLSIFQPECTENPQMAFTQASQYTTEMCAMDCIAIVANCGCSVFLADGVNVCEISTIEQCARNGSINIVNGGWSFGDTATAKIEECAKGCLPLCQSEEVETWISSSSYPSPAQVESILEHTTTAGFNSHITYNNTGQYAALDVYYKTLSVKVTERHVRSTFDELISNVGGQLGLWLGASVLTLVHLTVYLCGWIFTKAQRIKMPKEKVSPKVSSAGERSHIPTPIVPVEYGHQILI